MSRPFSQPLDIRRALTAKPPELDHVLPGLLSGTVGMMAGPGGSGKTTLELQIAVALATGTLPLGGVLGAVPGMPPKPSRVVLVAAEEQQEVLTHKLHAIAGAILRPAHDGGLGLEPSAFLELLEQNLSLFAEAKSGSLSLLDERGRVTRNARGLLRAVRGARLVILDPLRQFQDGDENNSGAMNHAVRLLRGLAAHSGAAVVFAHHTSRAANQMGFGDTAGAARGSTALTDGVRWQLNLSYPSRDWGKAHGIVEGQRKDYLLVDIPKANYLPPQGTQLLRRAAGGVLEWVPEGCASSSPAPRRAQPVTPRGRL